MGSLYNFNEKCENLFDLKKMYGCNTFVETGCFKGHSLELALRLNFTKAYSCDIDQEMIDHCNNRFSGDSRLELFKGTSLEFLEYLLPKLDDISSVMFYLDAHLPEYDKNSGSTLNNNLRVSKEHNFPLETELDLIYKYRKNRFDIIIADDLRIYEEGPFQGGNWSPRNQFIEKQGFKLDLDFLQKYEYNVRKFYDQEGYILLHNPL